jgi:hypothetical protein
MEYPTFVTAYARLDPLTPVDPLVWEVTIHELVHNWFQGMVATNEFEEAWLDEGVTTWGTTQIFDALGFRWDYALFVPPGARWMFSPFIHTSIPEREARGHPSVPRAWTPIASPTWLFRTGTEEGRSVYGRAAASLGMLEREVGPETFDRVMRTYAERWAFHHPSTDDFLNVVSEVSGKDLRPLGNALFRGTAGLDDEVTDLRCVDVPPGGGTGLHDVDGGTPVFQEAGALTDAWCEVLVDRNGDLRLPLDVQLTFQDGTRLRHRVPDGELWARIRTQRPAPGGRVTRAEVHPDATPPIDTDPVNDVRSSKSTPAPVLGLTGWFLYAAQIVAAAVGSLL